MNPNDSSILIAVAVIVVVAVLAVGYLCAIAERKDVEKPQPQPWNGKFIVLPGPVVSKSDGQNHYVPAHDLIRLYGVDPKDCIVTDLAFLNRYTGRGYVLLTPQYDGDYNIIRAFADANVLIPGEDRIDCYA